MLLEMLSGLLLGRNRVGIGTMKHVAFLKMISSTRPRVLRLNCFVLPFLHLVGADEAQWFCYARLLQ